MTGAVTERTKDFCYYYAIAQLPKIRNLRLDGARVDLYEVFQSALGEKLIAHEEQNAFGIYPVGQSRCSVFRTHLLLICGGFPEDGVLYHAWFFLGPNLGLG